MSTASTNGICEGRVVAITGAGRGIGREHALEFARQGALVVVNDLGAETDGSGGSVGPAQEVVNTIEALGGRAVVNGDDVATPEGAERLINTAIEVFGGIDVGALFGDRLGVAAVARREINPQVASSTPHPVRDSWAPSPNRLTRQPKALSPR